jgi:hypothetical protein
MMDFAKRTVPYITLGALLLVTTALRAQVPPVTGSPVIIEPELLSWPADFPGESPYLTEPTANRLNDFHGEFSNCDIVLSTAGNYHMALRELWQVYLHQYASDLDIRNWFYTTSPPVSPDQIPAQVVQFGNMNARCVPQVAVGPKGIMNTLIAAGYTEGDPVKIIKNYGNVILVKKGHPKNIETVWDLGRGDVTLVTPNPYLEPGSFGNFSGSIYNIAANDPNPPDGVTADDLFNIIFNGAEPYDRHFKRSRKHKCGDHPHGKHHKRHSKPQWVVGKRIMHREQPYAVFSGKADAGVIFYHLALYFVRSFPDEFEIVPLGGTVDDPQPLVGNKIGVMQAVRIKGSMSPVGDWSPKQLEARERLMQALTGPELDQILPLHGLRRP